MFFACNASTSAARAIQVSCVAVDDGFMQRSVSAIREVADTARSARWLNRLPSRRRSPGFRCGNGVVARAVARLVLAQQELRCRRSIARLSCVPACSNWVVMACSAVRSCPPKAFIPLCVA